MDAISFRNYHAPDEVRLFTVPRRGVRRWDEQAPVYDVQVGQDRVLRHYSFPDRWFEVNCSLDLAGRFVTEHHHGVDWMPPPWQRLSPAGFPLYDQAHRGHLWGRRIG